MDGPYLAGSIDPPHADGGVGGGKGGPEGGAGRRIIGSAGLAGVDLDAAAREIAVSLGGSAVN